VVPVSIVEEQMVLLVVLVVVLATMDLVIEQEVLEQQASCIWQALRLWKDF
jgi:hypothetical protein